MRVCNTGAAGMMLRKEGRSKGNVNEEWERTTNQQAGHEKDGGGGRGGLHIDTIGQEIITRVSE